ncbi:S8 family serine peptidase [Actinoplanes sp. NPDC051859]|uniref:S8 family peptidase n=1 Tax=Actinoplanes sp. NPDC051859 TaxID=3363909 RepID=UPI00378BB480
MISITGRHAARLSLAGLSAAVAVLGMADAAAAATPGALPLGTIRAAAAGAIPDSYIVVLKPGAPDAASHTLAQRYGAEIGASYSTAVHGFQADMTALEARRLAANPAVAYVEQDATVALADTRTQAAPVWGLDRIDQPALPLSKGYTYRSAATVTAYVLDTGIRVQHSEFGGRARDGRDFIDNDATAQDCNGHGTHVAGTIGGKTYGVAKDVNLVGIRVLNCEGRGAYSQFIAGVDWVTKNAVKPAVANMSLGGSASATLNAAVARSVASGVTYAVSAGNDNKDACGYSPASAAEAITVGATDSADARSSFSNYGKCVDLFAPGSRITSAGTSSDTATALMSGTSMAAPHVAGAAALVAAAYPAWTPVQISDALTAQARAGVVTNPGSGSPNRLLNTGFLNTVATAEPVAESPCGQFVLGTDVAIGKRSTATSSKTVTCTGTASAASTVHVTVRHGYRGSLVVSLIGPNGKTYLLKAAEKTDKAADIVQSYPIDLSGVSRSGKWSLQVKDTYGTTTGTLDKWKLTL